MGGLTGFASSLRRSCRSASGRGRRDHRPGHAGRMLDGAVDDASQARGTTSCRPLLQFISDWLVSPESKGGQHMRAWHPLQEADNYSLADRKLAALMRELAPTGGLVRVPERAMIHINPA
eukprot:scaffold42891_cov31-Prasinocladus_malaysianus.AAC.2